MRPIGYISDIQFNDGIDERSYLHSLPIVQHLRQHPRLSFNAPVTFFVGENGTGKSTLLEAIAVAFGFNAEGGSRNFNFSTNETHSELWEQLMLLKRDYPKDGFFLRAESLYNVATNIEEIDRIAACAPPIVSSYGGISLHHQSHGESFLSIVQNRFGGEGLYILDEPEAALSPTRQLTLLAEIHALVNHRSQFLIATHSPILMAYPHAEIYEFSENGVHLVDYRDTQHYQVTKRFLNDPIRLLQQLLEESEQP